MSDYTMQLQLCDDDGIVRRGAMHHGTDYPCTGHAHYAGEHIRCISPAHSDVPVMPGELLDLLRDQSIVVPQDGDVWALIGRDAIESGRFADAVRGAQAPPEQAHETEAAG